jgi:hypothetical protein
MGMGGSGVGFGGLGCGVGLAVGGRWEALAVGRADEGAVAEGAGAPVTVIVADEESVPTTARTVAVPGPTARTVPDVTAAMSGLDDVQAAPRAAAGAGVPSFMVPDSARSCEAPAAITTLPGLTSSPLSCLTARFVRAR